MADLVNGGADVTANNPGAAAAAEGDKNGFKSFAEFEAMMAKEGDVATGAAIAEAAVVRPASAIADDAARAAEAAATGDKDDEDLTPEQIAEAEAAAAQTPEQKAEAEAAAAKKGPEKTTLKGRLGQLVREKHEKDREAAAATARAEAAEAALAAERANPDKAKPTAKAGPKTDQPAPVTEEGRPSAEDFEFGEYDPAYQDALVEWRVERSLASREAKTAAVTEAETARRTEAERTTRWGGVIEKGAAKNADFEQKVLSGNGWKLSKQMWEMAVDSDVGHDVLYELASNPAESARIFDLPLTRQAAEFGKLEARFSQPLDAKSKSEVKDGATGHMPRAPAPQSRVRGAGGQYKPDAGTKDFAAFEAMIKAEEAAKAARQ